MRKRHQSQDWPAPLSGAEQLEICRELARARSVVRDAIAARRACCAAQDLLGLPEAIERHQAATREYQRIRNRLWETSMRLVVRWAMRYAGPSLDCDELVALGAGRVQRAIDKFDPERGIQFSTYVSVALKRDFARAVERAARRRATERTRGVVGDEEDSWESLVGWQEADDYDQAPYEVRDLGRVRQALGELPIREADVVLSRCRGEKQTSIAARHGFSKERARQLEQRALKTIAALVGRETVEGSLAKV